MRLRRREYLLTSGAALTGLAGCSSLSGGSDGDGGGGAGGGGDGSTPEGALELAFGEGAEFTSDSGVKLQVAMANPRLLETVPVVRDDEVIVDSPAERPYFLFVSVVVANEGSSAIEPPRGLFFTADGEEVERAAIRTPGQTYRDVGELAPGESAEATIAFPAPDGSGTGTVALRFQTLLESPPARWSFQFDDVPRETTDLTRDGLGESITVGKDAYAYEFTPTAARTTRSYTYGDGQTHTAPSGSTFVLVEARSENVGEEPVKLPNPYGVRLEAGGTVARGGQFRRADERYQGQVDPYPPGGSQQGVLLFEVPESAAEYTLRLAVGNQTFATWPIEPTDGGATPSPSG